MTSSAAVEGKRWISGADELISGHGSCAGVSRSNMADAQTQHARLQQPVRRPAGRRRIC